MSKRGGVGTFRGRISSVQIIAARDYCGGTPSPRMKFSPARLFLSVAFVSLAWPAMGKDYEVVVYGGSPAGLAAAITAAREKASVIVIEPTKWIGGMVTGGLSSTDKGREDTIGGFAREFFTRAATGYDPQFLFYAEPQTNLRTFEEMAREAGVEVVKGQRLKTVEKQGPRISGFTTADGTAYRGKVFIDATYEGDLMAKAGVSYTVGREGREAYGEALNGVRREKVRDFTMDVMTQGCPCVGGKGPHYVHGAPMKISGLDAKLSPIAGVTKSTAAEGSADKLTQAYNFRFCATQRPEILVPWPKPANYQPEKYELLLRLIQSYPGIPFSRLVHLGKIANGKVDLNAQGLFSTDYVGGNADYPDGDYAARDRIWQDHIDYLQGYFWFLANDPRVPEALRTEARSWGLCRDEFTDNGHWPYHLYVREARRMMGEYVMRQQDVQREIIKPDTVGMGSFIIDSHIVQRLVDEDGTVIDEGAFDAPARPYQMPYRSLTPRRTECENLLVPVCLSATHIAYGSIRMEPVYMAMGHASGLAAVAAARNGLAVQAIDVPALQAKLREQKQVIELKGLEELVLAEKLPGVVADDDAAELVGAWTSSSYAGGGVNGASRHDADSGKGQKSARFKLIVPADGQYEVRLSYTPAANRAANVPVSLEHADGTALLTVDQRKTPPIDKYFVSVGTFRFTTTKPVIVTIGNQGTKGYVVADAVQLLPVK